MYIDLKIYVLCSFNRSIRSNGGLSHLSRTRSLIIISMFIQKMFLYSPKCIEGRPKLDLSQIRLRSLTQEVPSKIRDADPTRV